MALRLIGGIGQQQRGDKRIAKSDIGEVLVVTDTDQQSHVIE